MHTEMKFDFGLYYFFAKRTKNDNEFGFFRVLIGSYSDHK